MSEKFTVGQELYFVPSRKGAEHRTYTIEKVGRQYITISNGMRAPIRTMSIENFGNLYLSKQHYEQSAAIDEAWVKFTRRIDTYRWHAPDGISLEEIEQAGKLIFSTTW